MSSQCAFADFADRRKGKGDGAGKILHRLSADDDVGADPNPIGGWREVQFGDATAHAGARRPTRERRVGLRGDLRLPQECWNIASSAHSLPANYWIGDSPRYRPAPSGLCNWRQHTPE